MMYGTFYGHNMRKICFSSYLDVLITVGTVVNDGERLLETGTPDADDISNQLTDSDDHL